MSPARSRQNTATGDEWFRVTTAPAEMHAARERADAIAKKEYENVFNSLEGYSYLDGETLELLQQRRADALGRLEIRLTADRISAPAMAAALLLCRLEAPSGRAYVARVLREGDAKQRAHVLRGVDSGILTTEDPTSQHYREFLFDEETMAEAMLRQLDDADPNVVKAAVQACGMLNPPGFQERLLRLAQRQQVPDRERVLYWLSKGPLTPAALDCALQRPAQPPAGNVARWGDSLLAAFAGHENRDLRELARLELKRRLAADPDDGKRGFDGSRLDILDTLAKTSAPDDLDWLRKTAYEERGLYAKSLLAALVRLEGDAGRARLLELFDDPQRKTLAVQIAEEAYARSEDQSLVTALARAADGQGARDLQPICSALLAIGGEAAVGEARRLVVRLDPIGQASVRRRLEGHSLERIAQGVVESRLFDDAGVAAAVDRLKQFEPEGDPPQLLDLLVELGVVVMFDAETGELPCRHDRLLLDFAAHSRSKFAPTAVSQEWRTRHADDDEAPYVLRFVHAGRLYTGNLRNLGDWYDVERIATLINRALADADCKERFMALATGDQMAAFVFADPQRLAPLAGKFHLSLSDNLNAAMHAGKEFEERVIKGIRQD